MNRAHHDKVMGSFGTPSWLVSTRDPQGNEGLDLRHDYWIIRTDNPSLLRKADRVIDFGLVVDAGTVLLSDRADDLLTGKILIAETLNGQLIPSRAAGTCVSLFSNFGWIVRWRLAIGLERFSDLTPAILESFFDKLRNGGVYSLIPIDERIQTLEQKISRGKFEVPIAANAGAVELQKIFMELGLAAKSLPEEVSIPILEMVRRVAPNAKFMSEIRRSWRRKAQRPQPRDLDAVPDQPAVSFSEQVLDVFAGLYRLSAVHALDHDPLGFDPYAKTSIHKRARQIGRPAARTNTIAPEQWLALLESAARWVVDLAEPAQKISKEVRPIIDEYTYGPARATSQRILTYGTPRIQAVIAKHWPNDLDIRQVMPSYQRSAYTDSADTRFTINEITYYGIASCFVLIGAFSARRRRELESLQEGCTRRDENGVWWLSSYIEKTIRDVDQIPVPATVALAVTRLETLSASAREAFGSKWLADVFLPSTPLPLAEGVTTKGKVFHTDALIMLKDLAAVSNIPLTAEGEVWKFGMHQLRRAFAIFYYYGYRYANLDALSRFLRHFDPEMTRVYITDVIPGVLLELKERRKAYQKLAEEAADANDKVASEGHRAVVQTIDDIHEDLSSMASGFREIKEGATVERMFEIYDGEEDPIGINAASIRKELEQMVELARQDIRIKSPHSNSSPDDLREALEPQFTKYAKTKNMEPVPGAIAACGWSPKRGDDLSRAKCITAKAAAQPGATLDDDRPDYAFATIDTCLGGCPFGIAFSQNRVAIDREIERTAKAAALAPSEPLRTAAQMTLDGYKSRIAGAEAARRGVR